MIYENINIPLWNALKNTAGKRVLDIGCGTGALGELLKEHDNHVEGITSSAEEARIAAERLDAVHAFDLDRVADADLPVAGPFDALVLGDVLEHLVSPRTTLEALLPLVGADGKVYVSLPNIACFYIRFGLLLGRFNMSSRGGILDVTHLHFYTRRTARALLEGAGLAIERTDYMPGIAVWAYQLLHRSRPPRTSPLRGDPSFHFYARRVYPVERLVALCWPGMFANQFIFTCRPAASSAPRVTG